MKNIIKILIAVFCIGFFVSVGGCEQVLTGIGIGTAGSEIINTYEQALEEKALVLDEAYDKAIANLEQAETPEEKDFARKEAEDLQVSRIANFGARTLIGEIKEKRATQDGSQPDLIKWGLGLVIAFAGNEMRKRKGFEKVVTQLAGEATPKQADHIHEVVKSKTRVLG